MDSRALVQPHLCKTKTPSTKSPAGPTPSAILDPLSVPPCRLPRSFARSHHPNHQNPWCQLSSTASSLRRFPPSLLDVSGFGSKLCCWEAAPRKKSFQKGDTNGVCDIPPQKKTICFLYLSIACLSLNNTKSKPVSFKGA